MDLLAGDVVDAMDIQVVGNHLQQLRVVSDLGATDLRATAYHTLMLPHFHLQLRDY